jgi:colicin import membrane protein
MSRTSLGGGKLMPAHAEAVDPDAAVAAVERDDGQPGVPLHRPNLRGDLDSVLEFMPSFRIGLRGYDRWQVDSYVAWAEREIRTARRACDELAARFGANAAELERARRQLAWSDAGRDTVEVGDRITRMLELAADEAGALTRAAGAEAGEIVEEARTYATAMLRRAREVEEAAAAETEQAARRQAEAAAALEQAKTDTAQLRAETAAERDRLDKKAAQDRDRLDRDAAAAREQAAGAAAQERQRLDHEAAVARERAAAQAAETRQRLDREANAVRERLDQEAAAERAQLGERAHRQREREAAAAAERIAAAQREVDDLHRQRDQAQQSLRRLTAQISQVLEALATGVPADSSTVEAPNIVAQVTPIASVRARSS